MKKSRLFQKYLVPAGLMFVLLINVGPNLLAQARTYPKEIRGYKVKLRDVDDEKSNKKSKDKTDSDSETDQLIQFGQAQLANASTSGLTLEIPLVVGPVKNSGHVEFLVFEDIVINGKQVEIDEYQHPFDLPGKQQLTLTEPLSLFISMPSVLSAAFEEWSDSKETWLVTGRIYVFAKFKKSFFTFKRCVPVELNLTIRNPLRGRTDQFGVSSHSHPVSTG
jgi:hypothetical protein